MRNRTSPIWKMSNDDFASLCKKSKSVAEIIRACGIEAEAGNYKTVNARIVQDKIDISHIKLGLNSNRGRRFEIKYTRETIVEAINSGKIKLSSAVKRQVIRWNLLPHNQCSICGLKDTWNGMKLSFQMDHINGNHYDHRLSNLRFVCPNCHTQTPTFSGKKTRKYANVDRAKAK